MTDASDDRDEVPFGAGEMFFSRTDKAGRILSGNRVFARISGYTMDEMRGRPHNLIRHPTMPRVVFAILWEEIKAGRPIGAYVRNLARDGRPYSVLATVFPVDGGYLSIRVKPRTPTWPLIDDLYRELRDVEQRAGARRADRDVPDPRGRDDGIDSPARKREIEASRAVLDERLHALGFADYRAFMQVAVADEISERMSASPAPVVGASGDVLGRVADAAQQLRLDLRAMVGGIGAYAGTSATLRAESEFVRTLAEDIRLFSFNALFASARLGRAGVALVATAGLMRDGSQAAGARVHRLGESIGDVRDVIDDLRFRIANLELRSEATALFAEELAPGPCRGEAREDDNLRAQDLRALTESLDRGVDGLGACLTRLDQGSTRLLGDVRALDSDLTGLNVLQMNARVESARISADESVKGLFTTVGGQVRAARERLAAFDTLRTVGARDGAAESHARTQVALLADAIRGL